MNKTFDSRNRKNLMIDKAKKWDPFIEELLILHIKLFSEFFRDLFFYHLLLDLFVNIIFPELVQRVGYSLL